MLNPHSLRYEGYWLSPDSSLVAFEEVDESGIPEYRIMHQGSDRLGEGAQVRLKPFFWCSLIRFSPFTRANRAPLVTQVLHALEA